VATLVAVMLRGNFDTVSESLIILMPYTLISIGSVFVVFLAAGLDRTAWRYSTVADHLQVVVLTVLAILLTLVVTFALNRLEPVARSLPVLQGGLIVTILVFVRGAARFWHTRCIHINGNGHIVGQPHETVLVVGVNTVTELFLLSVKEFASQRVQVAGILAEEPSMRGRTIQQKPVLGIVEELQEILQSLEVHGLAISKIVVATAVDRLRPSSVQTLLEVERSSDIVVQFIPEQLGFEDLSQKASVVSSQERKSSLGQMAGFQLRHTDLENSMRKSFRFGKRLIDVFGAALLGFALAPVAVLVAFIAALDVGFPVIFWQQRPGLYGRPFKLYKFRTMRAPHDQHRRRIPDDQRSSAVGQLIRRIRLDELPQLYNVLVGDMSLVGPRPLLPCDQSPFYAARLSVRPGLTGWAQVNGGRIISTTDKCVLDIWYAQNASFELDFKIMLSTVKMIFFGDRINIRAVNQARKDLDSNARFPTTMIAAE
jgi:lipopolysaccharide/colanic/teichoic acid biosynthesis glycosyltransferase